MKIRYPPSVLSGESRAAWEKRALRPWRMEIKIKLLNERGWKCERCSKKFTPSDITSTIHLDETIIPRCDMRGLSVQKRRLAFCEINLTLSCQNCNCNHGHDRRGAFKRACQLYGESIVRDWYDSLGLKAPIYEFMPNG